jgi:hypothetical protein
MKKFNYEQYDYSFLYGILTKKQREEAENILNQFIGYPNTESTRMAIKMAIDNWLKINNIEVNKFEISYE